MDILTCQTAAGLNCFPGQQLATRIETIILREPHAVSRKKKIYIFKNDYKNGLENPISLTHNGCLLVVSDLVMAVLKKCLGTNPQTHG